MTSQQHVMGSRWGAQLEGEAPDLENIRSKVNGAIVNLQSPFISMVNDVTVLRCAKWDSAKEWMDARLLAIETTSIIVTAVGLLDGVAPVEVGTVYDFSFEIPERKRKTDFYSFARAAPENRRSAEEFGRLLKASENDKIATAMIELPVTPTWFDVFKTYEALRRYHGDQDKFHRAFPEHAADLERVRRTANSYRHARKSYDPIKNPIDISASVSLLKSLLLRVAEAATAATDYSKAASYSAPDLTLPAGEPAALNRLTVESQHPAITIHNR